MVRPGESGGGAAAAAAVVVVLLVVLGLVCGVGVLFFGTRQSMVAQVEMERAIAEARAVEARVEADRQFAAAIAASEAESASSDDMEREAVVATPSDEAVEAVLNAQRTAWNEGDIEAFMDHYWKSDDLTFSSSGKVTRGWQATLDNYKERYPSRDAMGTLAFTDLEVQSLGSEAALVIGDWQLTRDSGDVGGKFTVIFRRLEGRWVIVHDHTSRREATP